MTAQKQNQLIRINPDLIVAILLRFVENQLDAEVQMGDIDIAGVFRCAAAGMSHIADDVSGSYGTAFGQSERVRVILTQMGVVIIPFMVKAADSDPPAAVLVPAKRFYGSGFYGRDEDVYIRRSGAHRSHRSRNRESFWRSDEMLSVHIGVL